MVAAPPQRNSPQVAGDLNAESLEEVTAVAQAVCGLQGLDVHPLLFGAADVPSPATSQTLRRKSRIDYIMFSDNGLLTRIDDDATTTAPLPEGACIPDPAHPRKSASYAARSVRIAATPLWR